MTINFELSEESIDAAIRQINEYTDKVRSNTEELVKAAADRTSELCSIELTKHVETGETLESLQTDTKQSSKSVNSFSSRVICGGAAVWLEFGTGVVANGVAPGDFVHPLPGVYFAINGIGTYGKGHGADPNGWWYYDQYGHKRHTYGIPATMFMYRSLQTTRREIADIAKGVFSA